MGDSQAPSATDAQEHVTTIDEVRNIISDRAVSEDDKKTALDTYFAAFVGCEHTNKGVTDIINVIQKDIRDNVLTKMDWAVTPLKTLPALFKKLEAHVTTIDELRTTSIANLKWGDIKYANTYLDQARELKVLSCTLSKDENDITKHIRTIQGCIWKFVNLNDIDIGEFVTHAKTFLSWKSALIAYRELSHALYEPFEQYTSVSISERHEALTKCLKDMDDVQMDESILPTLYGSSPSMTFVMESNKEVLADMRRFLEQADEGLVLTQTNIAKIKAYFDKQQSSTSYKDCSLEQGDASSIKHPLWVYWIDLTSPVPFCNADTSRDKSQKARLQVPMLKAWETLANKEDKLAVLLEQDDAEAVTMNRLYQVLHAYTGYGRTAGVWKDMLLPDIRATLERIEKVQVTDPKDVQFKNNQVDNLNRVIAKLESKITTHEARGDLYNPLFQLYMFDYYNEAAKCEQWIEEFTELHDTIAGYVGGNKSNVQVLDDVVWKEADPGVFLEHMEAMGDIVKHFREHQAKWGTQEEALRTFIEAVDKWTGKVSYPRDDAPPLFFAWYGKVQGTLNDLSGKLKNVNAQMDALSPDKWWTTYDKLEPYADFLRRHNAYKQVVDGLTKRNETWEDQLSEWNSVCNEYAATNGVFSSKQLLDLIRINKECALLTQELVKTHEQFNEISSWNPGALTAASWFSSKPKVDSECKSLWASLTSNTKIVIPLVEALNAQLAELVEQCKELVHSDKAGNDAMEALKKEHANLGTSLTEHLTKLTELFSQTIADIESDVKALREWESGPLQLQNAGTPLIQRIEEAEKDGDELLTGMQDEIELYRSILDVLEPDKPEDDILESHGSFRVRMEEWNIQSQIAILKDQLIKRLGDHTLHDKWSLARNQLESVQDESQITDQVEKDFKETYMQWKEYADYMQLLHAMLGLEAPSVFAERDEPDMERKKEELKEKREAREAEGAREAEAKEAAVAAEAVQAEAEEVNPDIEDVVPKPKETTSTLTLMEEALTAVLERDYNRTGGRRRRKQRGGGRDDEGSTAFNHILSQLRNGALPAPEDIGALEQDSHVSVSQLAQFIPLYFNPSLITEEHKTSDSARTLAKMLKNAAFTHPDIMTAFASLDQPSGLLIQDMLGSDEGTAFYKQVRELRDTPAFKAKLASMEPISQDKVDRLQASEAKGDEHADKTLVFISALCVWAFLIVLFFTHLFQRYTDIQYKTKEMNDVAFLIPQLCGQISELLDNMALLKQAWDVSSPNQVSLFTVDTIKVMNMNGFYQHTQNYQVDDTIKAGAKITRHVLGKWYEGTKDNDSSVPEESLMTLNKAIRATFNKCSASLYVMYVQLHAAIKKNSFIQTETISVPFPWNRIMASVVVLLLCVLVIFYVFTSLNPFPLANEVQLVQKCEGQYIQCKTKEECDRIAMSDQCANIAVNREEHSYTQKFALGIAIVTTCMYFIYIMIDNYFNYKEAVEAKAQELADTS